MSTVRIWSFRMIISLLVLFLLFNLYFPMARRMTGKPFPSLGGVRQALVLTGSMAPTVMAGDLILFREQILYQTGDIVTYLDGARLVTHRIVTVQPDHMITQGDANNVADNPISHSQILGKMIFRLPRIGALAWFLKTPAGMASVLVLMLIFSQWNRVTSFLFQKRAD